MAEQHHSLTQPRFAPLLGCNRLGDGGCEFRVWAPLAQQLEVHLVEPEERVVPMNRGRRGYYHAKLEDVPRDSLYFYRIDGRTDRPDPASRFQPKGVHGPSAVSEPGFRWQDQGWSGLPLQQYIFYELHTGTFSTEGTFEGVIPHLDYLKDLGITAIEIMPVSQFPGARNWGYDGVYPFAVQDSYGGPAGLKTLVNACHQKGLAVAMDVVYNHFGPEGNYLSGYAPYFTDRYRTPWGEALNFDGPLNEEVRTYFIENALYWITEFHIDALRLDAVHAIIDGSACPFLLQLTEAVHRRGQELNRKVHVIAESDLNDSRLVKAGELGGYNMDAQWSDDFHHSLHVLLTGEQGGYYRDFHGVRHLEKAFAEGYVYSGHYSKHRGQRHGNSSRDLAACKFVVCSQNHDQVGNRMLGDRMTTLASFERLKLAAGTVLLSPNLPLLFMGEEYAETAPFQYFVSHTDEGLVEAVRKGRKAEFSAFAWSGQVPDPQAEETFLRSKLNHQLRNEGSHATLLEFYRELMRLRKTIPALSNLSKTHMQVFAFERQNILFLRRWWKSSQVFAIFHYGSEDARFDLPVDGPWRKLVDSAEERWRGTGSRVPDTLPAGERLSLELRGESLVLFQGS